MTGRARASAAVLIAATALMVAGPAPAALAHPLGNFSVNHYNGLTLQADRIDLLTIIDTAEIPTQQAAPAIDTDGDDVLSTEELATAAIDQCAEVAAAVTVSVGTEPVRLEAAGATLETVPGAAGLTTLRLTCPRTASVDLSRPAVLTIVDDYRPDRVGWHEITAAGDGVRLIDPPVASTSVSAQLRSYPVHLLESPLDLRSATIRAEPGAGGSTSSFDPAGSSTDPFTRLVAAGDRALQDLIGDRPLTPVIGGLALVLAVLLGAGHALLPGHGKTVMAAYLAGRRGSRRDAWLVGATVTVTHTASVLVLGLLVSVSAAVIGEQVLRVLGIVSGLLIAAVGLALLGSAMRARRLEGGRPGAVVQDPAPMHAHHDHAHGHAHVHHEHHDRSDGSAQGHRHDHAAALARDNHDHDTVTVEPPAVDHASDSPHRHGWLAGHQHGPAGHSHDHTSGQERPSGRLGIVGMGLAGGLVPSPSALVVLLGAIALGRTAFGVLLVLAYGVGMAGTLTAVGLLLVRFRDRMDRFGPTSRVGRAVARLGRALPVVTALLVLVVGLGLVVRGLLLAS